MIIQFNILNTLLDKYIFQNLRSTKRIQIQHRGEEKYTKTGGEYPRYDLIKNPRVEISSITLPRKEGLGTDYQQTRIGAACNCKP